MVESCLVLESIREIGSRLLVYDAFIENILGTRRMRNYWCLEFDSSIAI
jgi:hypothetical protein